MKKINSVKDLSVSYAATASKRRGNLNREGKGGFTMVELVVALVIIAIVSLATVSLIITQNNMNQKATQVIEATNVAENAIECFRFAVNTSKDDDYRNEFVEAFNGTGHEISGDGPYELVVHGATIKITIVDNTITIDAIASDGDIIIDKKSYTK